MVAWCARRVAMRRADTVRRSLGGGRICTIFKGAARGLRYRGLRYHVQLTNCARGGMECCVLVFLYRVRASPFHRMGDRINDAGTNAIFSSDATYFEDVTTCIPTSSSRPPPTILARSVAGTLHGARPCARFFVDGYLFFADELMRKFKKTHVFGRGRFTLRAERCALQ